MNSLVKIIYWNMLGRGCWTDTHKPVGINYCLRRLIRERNENTDKNDIHNDAI